MRIRLTAAILFIAAMLSVSCSDEDEERQPEWFPLRVGARWIYDAIADSVISTQDINGHTYYELAGYSLLWRGSLVRMNDLGQLMILGGDSEQVFFDFNAPAGSNWMLTSPHGPYQVSVENRNLPNVVVPAGTFSGCYEFIFQSPAIDNSWRFIVAPQVGVVFKEGGFGFTYKLVRADL